MADFGWIIGLAIYAIGRSSMALAANLQRLSLRREALKPEHERLPKEKQPLLAAGIVLYAGSGIFLSFALIFASPTLLAPCGTIIFLANAIFAYYINGEKFLWREDAPPMVLIVFGVTAVVMTAPKENKEFSNDELKELCAQPSFILFIAFLTTFIIVNFAKSRLLMGRDADVKKPSVPVSVPSTSSGSVPEDPHGPRRRSRRRMSMAEVGQSVMKSTLRSSLANATAFAQATSPAVEAATIRHLSVISSTGSVSSVLTASFIADLEAIAELDSDEEAEVDGVQSETTMLKRKSASVQIDSSVGIQKKSDLRLLIWYMSFGMLAGGLGGLNITFTKSIFSLIAGELEKGGILGVFTTPSLWVIGILLGGTFVLQMASTTDGLDKTPASIFVPTQSVTEEGMAVLGGLFYFQDFELFTPSTAVVFALGAFCTIFATCMLTLRQLKRKERSKSMVTGHGSIECSEPELASFH